MTRAFLPPQPAASPARVASLAQTLRPARADLAAPSARFSDLLSGATRPAADPRPTLDQPTERSDRREDTRASEREQPADSADPAGDPPSDIAEPEADQTRPADTQPDKRPTEEPQDDPVEASEGLASSQPLASDPPSQAPDSPQPVTDPSAAPPNEQPPKSPAHAPSQPPPKPPEGQKEQPEAGTRAPRPEPIEQAPRTDEAPAPERPWKTDGPAQTLHGEAREVDREGLLRSRDRSIQAPSAEDQKRERIAVETRFDAAIRDRVQNAAKIDLAALAAEKLVSPTQRIPGDLREASPRHPAFERPRETPARAPEPPPPPAERHPEARSEAPISGARPDSWRPPSSGRSPETPTSVTDQSAAPQNASATLTGERAARSPASPAQATAPIALTTPQAAQSANAVKSFDRAIAALRSLGAEAGKPRSQPAKGPRAQGQQPQGAEADRARPLLTQVSRGVASILRQNGGSLSLRLRPDALGELKINLRVRQGAVEATFKADNAQARDLLKSTLSQLKDTLETHGVRVDRLRVELSDNRTQDASAHRSEHRDTAGDGSPGFENPSETGGRDHGSPHHRHGGRDGPHGRGQQHAPAEPGRDQQHAGLDAEATRDERWIGVDTLA